MNYFNKNSYLIFILKFTFLILLFHFFNSKKLKIGVVGVRHEVNIGNNLLKYAISIKLKELGFIPYIIGTHWNNYNISFINKTTKLVIIKNNFSEIKENDYDILMVNSDQTWRKFDKHFYDYGFLKFAENWKIKKFIYGASLGYNYWTFNSKDEKIIKSLLNNFTGISVREKGSIKLIKKYLGINTTFVLDPTLLIDKKYYLNLIKNYKCCININNNYILIYLVSKNKSINILAKNASEKLKYKIYYFYLNKTSIVENFLYLIVNCKAVITNSYHGTIFSIIFNKPFISFNKKRGAKERLISLGELFGFSNRIFDFNQNPNIRLLIKPLKINYSIINILRKESINYIKKNLFL